MARVLESLPTASTVGNGSSTTADINARKTVGGANLYTGTDTTNYMTNLENELAKANFAKASSSDTTTGATSSTTTSSGYSAPSSYQLKEYNSLKSQQAAAEKRLNSAYDQYLAQANSQTDYATNQAVDSYRRQYEDAVNSYDTNRATASYNQAQAADNMALYNAANGDKGGMGQAQYNAQMRQYDNAILQIDLEQQNLKNEVERSVADAIAQGDYTKAQSIYEIGIARQEQLNALSQQYASLRSSLASGIDSYNLQVASQKAAYAQQQAEAEAAAAKEAEETAVTDLDLALLYNNIDNADAGVKSYDVIKGDGTKTRAVVANDGLHVVGSNMSSSTGGFSVGDRINYEGSELYYNGSTFVTKDMLDNASKLQVQYNNATNFINAAAKTGVVSKVEASNNPKGAVASLELASVKARNQAAAYQTEANKLKQYYGTSTSGFRSTSPEIITRTTELETLAAQAMEKADQYDAAIQLYAAI